MGVGEERVQAWIDAGGTFTDCYVALPSMEAKPDNQSQIGGIRDQLRSCKILSSGRVPIRLIRAGTLDYLAPELKDDPSAFWVDAQAVLIDSAGNEVERIQVARFESQDQAGRLRFVNQPTNKVQDFRVELDSGIEAPVLGVRRLLACPLTTPLPSLNVRLGTTRGTNALLTRNGAQTAFAITAPFEDLLAIGDQTREDLFAMDIEKAKPLPDQIVGIHARMDSQGRELQKLDLKKARKELQECFEAGAKSLAICLMHSYCNDDHETQLEKLAHEIGFQDVSISSRVASLIEIVARAQTTVLDAYLSPVIRGYLKRLKTQFQSRLKAEASETRWLESATADTTLLVMTSAGGLVPWESYSGKDSILSGPAGGICALQSLRNSVKKLGYRELIGLDMGGTSTDVSRVSSEHNLQYESKKAGIRILTPTLPIETVAAGGGSVCWFDGVSLRVGPQSAGANPGPACYGKGGPLTITDLNVFLRRIPVTQFPFALDLDAVQSRLKELLRCTQELGFESTAQLVQGFRRLANEQMAEAVRSVTIAQGADPRSHVLVGFGGAAGQHICEVAELLDVQHVLDSTEAGKLSALGMGLASLRADEVLPVYEDLENVSWSNWARKVLEARSEALALHSSEFVLSIWLELRYQGTDATLTVEVDDLEGAEFANLRGRFEEEHQRRFGYARKRQPIELVSIRLERTAPCEFTLPVAEKVERDLKRRMKLEHGAAEIPVINRKNLLPGDHLEGPVIVANQGSTLVVEANWELEVLSDETLLLGRCSSQGSGHSEGQTKYSGGDLDPVFRDCYASRLTAIATQMGIVLQQTAVSVNVKQRRDFSCAVFDANGNLLANAPHVPVHLGAMGQTVRSILRTFPKMRAGQSFITNDPYCGGSHLPDVTVVSPVCAADDHGRVQMLVANRAHHADVGGLAPGSMSVKARRLGEEGVILPPMLVADEGEILVELLQAAFVSAQYPPRDPLENLADIRAQVAANERGIVQLREYAARESWDKLNQYAEHLMQAACERVKQYIATKLQSKITETLSFADMLDDGSQVCVTVSRLGDKLRFDFEGSAGESSTNFNANPSIVTAAVLYVLRLLIRDDLPLNEGVLRAIEINVPDGLLNPVSNKPAKFRPAVAAGNVETSQRVVDVLLGAFGEAAASQGTMNNFLFGNEEFGFYETICGGAGATALSDGASAVHTHMTNTRLTDPEVLEAKYPVRLIEFCIRKDSGGHGQNKGGDGVVREFEFLENVTVSLLTSRRLTSPFGLAGGESGKPGLNMLFTQDANGVVTRQVLSPCCSLDVEAGTRLRLETPGGGGFKKT